jgi:hypothetical protein
MADFWIEILNVYVRLNDSLPTNVQRFVSFILIVFLVVLYSIFVWKFYSSISRKNMFELDLNQYNPSKNPYLEKTLAILIYTFEYLIIFPVLIFIWFAVFTVFLILLTDLIEIETLLLISATVITAIRLTSYYRKKLSEDLAKLIPFTLLAVSLLNPDFFSVERIITQFQEISLTSGSLFIYFIFILVLEIILRAVDLIFSNIGLKTEGDNETNEES